MYKITGLDASTYEELELEFNKYTPKIYKDVQLASKQPILYNVIIDPSFLIILNFGNIIIINTRSTHSYTLTNEHFISFELI